MGWGLEKEDFQTVRKLIPTLATFRLSPSGELDFRDPNDPKKPLEVKVLRILMRDAIADKARAAAVATMNSSPHSVPSEAPRLLQGSKRRGKPRQRRSPQKAKVTSL